MKIPIRSCRKWVIACVVVVWKQTASVSASSLYNRQLTPHPPQNWLTTTYTTRTAFAGGFGNKPFSPKKKKKTNKKKRKLSDDDLLFSASPKPQNTDSNTSTNNGPQLDKWGLPIPTQDELFPPMPEGTELIATPNDNDVTLDDIRAAMKDHLKLNYDAFDDSGTEKRPLQGNEPMQLHLLHQSPPVLSIENFFTSEECSKVQTLVVPDTNSDDSGVMQVNSATFSPLAQSQRTSTTWYCHYAQISTLLAKATHVIQKPQQHMEEPQIVRYRTGEQFSWHYDEIPPEQLVNGGQRVGTLLVYLNDVENGGGTIFRDLVDSTGNQLTMKPKQGSALFFFPAFEDGRPDDRTLHKGEVAMDEKWIAQMWIHERDYNPVVPEGNSHAAAEKVVEETKKKLGYAP